MNATYKTHTKLRLRLRATIFAIAKLEAIAKWGAIEKSPILISNKNMFFPVPDLVGYRKQF